MKSFDQAAHTYETFGFIQREMAAWLAEWLPSRREGTAIEVGAGTGFFTQHLCPWRGSLLATDASPAMVAQGAARWPGFDWKVALADDLPDLPAQWIFSSSFAQWANDPASLMRHWKSRLDENGRVLTGLFTAPTLTEVDQVLPGAAPLQWRSSADWRQSAEEAGLRIVRSESVERTFHFRSALELFRTLHGVGAAPERRVSGAALREAMKAYDRRFACPNGVKSTWNFFRFEAAPD